MTTELEQAKTETETQGAMSLFSGQTPDSDNVILFKTSDHFSAIKAREHKLLNHNELKTIYALLSYVSYNQHVRQDVVRHAVEKKFGVADVDYLQQKDYDDVVRFLVDLRLDE